MSRHWHGHLPVFSRPGVQARGGGTCGGRDWGWGGQSLTAGTPIPLHAASAAFTSGQGQLAGHATAHKTAGDWQIDPTVMNLPPPSTGEFYECWYTSQADGLSQRPLITAGTFTVP
jgi:hypothetical protein